MSYTIEGWENSDPARRVRKTRFRIAEYSPSIKTPSLHHPVIQSSSDLELIAQEPQLDLPDLMSLIPTLPSIQRNLAELFVYRNGPQEVIRGIHKDRTSNPQLYLDPQTANDMALRIAVGDTFKRIGYLWLNDQLQEKGTLLLDPGRSKYVARALTQDTDLYLNPDGLIFRQIGSRSVLQAICKYNGNPERLRVKANLTQLTINMRDFIESFGSKHFDFPLRLDRRNQTYDVTVAKRPKMLVVIPQDRQAPDLDDTVSIIPLPITSGLVKQIALCCIQPLLSQAA